MQLPVAAFHAQDAWFPQLIESGHEHPAPQPRGEAELGAADCTPPPGDAVVVSTAGDAVVACALGCAVVGGAVVGGAVVGCTVDVLCGAAVDGCIVEGSGVGAGVGAAVGIGVGAGVGRTQNG
jgi:hypothetical protein